MVSRIPGRFDFHLHSHCSDGARSPRELLALAARAGLAGVSITDHDTADAYRDLDRPPDGLRLLPGIEVSAARGGVELHILSYFPRGVPARLEALVDRLVGRRQDRIREGIERLAARGMPLEIAEVEAEAKGRVWSRGHLAQALVRKRLLPHINAAFPEILGPDTVRPPEEDAADVVAELGAMGGVTVWAHPSPSLIEQFLPPLVEAGLLGIELHTPRRRAAERRRLETLIAGRGLLVTGGSDWHGHGDSSELGRYWVERDEVAAFLEAVGWAA